MTKCKYYKTCKYVEIDGFTCKEDGGGEYCGRWRENEEKEKYI